MNESSTQEEGLAPAADRNAAYFVVGIGASAGGLEALRSFFAAMPEDSGLAFVVIQHLAPDHKSLMVELLARATRIPVSRAEEGTPLEPNHIYLIPPRFNLLVEGGTLHLTPHPGGKSLNLPIDLFFRSLAQDCGDKAVAVILSGTGSDGARGIRAVKEAGGMIMVQAEASAKFAGMPSSAIATGAADFILPVEEMPAELLKFIRHPFSSIRHGEAVPLPENSTHRERVCQRLREVTGIDFSHYKHATFARRIERRMNILQVQDIQEYLHCLTQSGREAEALGKDLLIGVTKFFRDTESFEALSQHLRPLFRKLQAGGTLRLWSAACSTGEEAYTLAMICEEIRSQEFPRTDFKVFATDVDKTALEIAGAGIYPRSVVADIPADLLERYFQSDGKENFRISRSLRDRLIFARQDLLADPPFTKINALTCRNLLIYLRPESQRKLLSLFHFALNPGGLLFLGSSETLGDMAYAFEGVDSRHRIHRKKGDVGLKLGDTIPHVEEAITTWTGFGDEARPMTRGRRSAPAGLDTIQQHLLQRFAPATLVMTRQHQLLYTLGPVNRFFTLPSGPVALDVLKMVPRDLGLAISTASSQALREGKSIEFRAIRFQSAAGETESLRLEAEAFDSRSDHGNVLLITLHTEAAASEGLPSDSGEEFNRDHSLLDRIQSLEQELQSTRENLQASIEQQETANEELQAANEELLAANEELQSTNEELESVNEELYTVNAEYQGKIQELIELNDDMSNFARSTDIGTLFIDADFRIRRFTPMFASLTGLEDADVGRSLSTFGHPLLHLLQQTGPRLIRRSSGVHEEVVDLADKGTFLLRVIPYRVENNEIEGLVASLVDISRIYDAEEELKTTLQTVDVGICVTDESGRFTQVNQAYCRIYGYQPEELIGRPFTLVVPKEHQEYAMKLHNAFLETGEELPGIWSVVDRAGDIRRVAVRASLLRRRDGSRRKITVVTDIRDLQALQTEVEALHEHPA